MKVLMPGSRRYQIKHVVHPGQHNRVDAIFYVSVGAGVKGTEPACPFALRNDAGPSAGMPPSMAATPLICERNGLPEQQSSSRRQMPDRLGKHNFAEH